MRHPKYEIVVFTRLICYEAKGVTICFTPVEDAVYKCHVTILRDGNVIGRDRSIKSPSHTTAEFFYNKHVNLAYKDGGTPILRESNSP